MSDTSTLHVPLQSDVRKKFSARAKQLGFDSAQAYLRVMIKAEVDGRRISFDIDDWGEPSDNAANRLNAAANEARQEKSLSQPFYSVDDFMKDL